MARPSKELLAWAAGSLGGGEVVDVGDLGKNDGPQPTWLLRVKQRGTTHDVVLKAGPLDWTAGFTAEAAGMEFATEHDLPAPRLVAADLEGRFGVLAVLSTSLPGEPWRAWKQPGLVARLRALGAAAARLHAIALAPRPRLPLRTHHIPHDDYSAERRWAARFQAAADHDKDAVFEELLAETGWPPGPLRQVVTLTRTTPLLREAEERIAQASPPEAATVFVHADLHTGNTLWDGDTLTGIVDWDSAGAGQPGVDLGSLRLDAAMNYDLAAAQEIVNGWQDASQQVATDLAYWDVVSALNTSADCGDQTPRRDAFLRAALDRL
jgi:Ser/Thr protein kinase RdoA (MazF antagonist)